MQLIVLLVVSLFGRFGAVADSFCSTDENGHQTALRVYRRNAVELRAYHQQQRIRHKDYIPTYPPDYVLDLIKLGKSEEMFYVSLETGVDTLWLLDSSYPYVTDETPTFNASDPDSSAINSGQAFSSVTGDSAVYGKKYYDIVEYFFPINQSFGAVDRIEGPWYDPGFEDVISGSFGLSYNPDLGNQPVTVDSAPILNMFALYPEMPRYYVMAIGEYLENGTAVDTGCLTFGAFPDLFCKTNPIASASLYYDYTYNSLSFNLDSFGYGSQRVNGGTAKMDSGLPMILVPLEAFNLLFNAIQPDYDYELQLYTTDCSNAGVLDDLVFTIGNVDLNVPSTVYIIDLSLGDGRCVVKFSLSNDFTTPFALGLPFTDTFCVKWDIDNNTISMFNFVD